MLWTITKNELNQHHIVTKISLQNQLYDAKKIIFISNIYNVIAQRKYKTKNASFANFISVASSNFIK